MLDLAGRAKHTWRMRLVLFLLLLPPVFSLATYAVFWWVNWRAGLGARVRGAYGGVLRPTAVAAWHSTMTVFLQYALYPLGLLDGFFNARASGRGTHVLLIHGLNHNAAAWLFYRYRLRRAGLTNVRTWSYNSLTRSAPELVSGATAEVQRVLRQNPDRKVLLVGHSLGGLIVRAVAASPELSGRVAGAVTIGTPWRGSVLARLGVGRLAHSLRPHAAFIRRLAALPLPADVAGLSLYTLMDNMVLPLDSLDCPLPHWQREDVGPTSHVALLYHPRTARRTVEFLCSHAQSGDDACRVFSSES